MSDFELVRRLVLGLWRWLVLKVRIFLLKKEARKLVRQVNKIKKARKGK